LPEYLFKNKETGEEQLLFMRISEYDEYVANNPHLEQLVYGAPMIIDPMRVGQQKPSSEFREKLKSIKNAHHGSSIDTW
jgi:hypothetical protein